MTPENTADGEGRVSIDRRTILRRGAIAAGGLALGGVGVAASDEPDTYEIDLTGQTLDPVPCLGEKVEIKQGTRAITEDSQSSRGNCRHYQFHWHYTERLIVEGVDTGRIWSGQGSKNQTITVCPPYPGEETVTNSTTITSDTAEEDRVVQFRFVGHATVNANGDLSVSFVDGEFRCHS